ncbi:MAG: DUF2834 domain-containing protein [Deltaproteobacteria bacterium]|nr:MAG: DUF2834 domain-containing protein [Deltaproteobacteria bacterium]
MPLLRATLLALWLALLGWAFFVAPPSDGLDGARAIQWLAFQGDPSLVAVFNLLGVWPMIFAACLLRDPPQPVPAWPFVALSFALGGFVLLPYLVLRRWGAPPHPSPGLARRLLTGRPFAVFILLFGSGLLLWGALYGSWPVFLQEARRSQLVSAMSADFIALILASWAVILDDVRRHEGPRWAALVAAVPVIGPPIWLLLRPDSPPSGGSAPAS